MLPLFIGGYCHLNKRLWLLIEIVKFVELTYQTNLLLTPRLEPS